MDLVYIFLNSFVYEVQFSKKNTWTFDDTPNISKYLIIEVN